MIKIAFISDIHFGKDGRGDFKIPYGTPPVGDVNTEENMGTDLIASLQKSNPEYLFISGDLTSVGSPAEYFYCEKKILEIASQVGIDKNKIIWCTGNHDNDWSISKLADQYGSTEGNKQYSKEVEDIALERYSQIAISVVEKNIVNLPIHSTGILPASGIYDDEKIIVFILNSSTKCTHTNNAGFSHGEITTKQLSWLEEKLAFYQSDPRWKIVMLHHHPFPYQYPTPCVDPSLLSDGSELLEVLGKGGVHLVLHGHRHHPRCITEIQSGWKNPIAFICAGSLSVSEKQRSSGDIPNFYHILELDEKNIGQLFFRSYQYGIGEGWTPAQNRGTLVPIDPVMKLGKIIDDVQATNALNLLVSNPDPVFSFDWDQLSDDLKYRSCKEINSLAMQTLSSRFQVKANLPINLTLIRR